MPQFILNYPDKLLGILKKTSEELNEDMGFIIAGKLYDMGKLTCGKAAEIVGLSRIEFLKRLGDYGFHAINLDGEQIETEIQNAKEL